MRIEGQPSGIKPIDDLDSVVASSSARDRVRERIVLDMPRPIRKTRVKKSVIAGGLLASAAVLAFAAFRPVDYSGPEIVRADSVARPLDFSDGTEFTVAPKTEVRVRDVSARGASIVLEKGEIEARVVHRVNTKWSIAAGPFLVRVTGTKFTTKWDPKTYSVAVILHEGSVVVDGCGVQRVVKGGESFVAICSQGVLEDRSPANIARPVVQRGDAPQLIESQDVGRKAVGEPIVPVPSFDPDPYRHPSVVAPSGVPSSGAVSTLSPSEQSEKTVPPRVTVTPQHAVAAEAAEPKLPSQGTTDRLFREAREARYAGDRARATDLYRQIRVQAPHTEASSLATFELGRIAFGVNQKEAARWFALYLEEAPSGVFAREALGRLLESTVSFDETGAIEIAKRYIAAYPEGPHRPTADKVVRSMAKTDNTAYEGKP